MVCCSAPFCNKEEGPEVVFFPMPDMIKEKETLQIWKERLMISVIVSSRTYHICHRHFSDDQYYSTAKGRLRLYPNAVPDLHVMPHKVKWVCRFCLEKPINDYQLIFPAWPKPNSPTAEEIQEILGIRVSQSDQLPQLICVTCITKINYIKRIRNQFQKNDRHLRETMEPPPPPSPPAPKNDSVEVQYNVTTTNGSETPMTFVIENVAHVEEVTEDSASLQYSILQGKYSTQAHLLNGESIAMVKEEEVYQEDGMSSSQAIKNEPTDESLLYTEYASGVDSHDNEQIKLEPHGADFGHLQSDDSEPDEPFIGEEDHSGSKRLRYGL